MADSKTQPQGQGGRTAQDINKLIGGLNTDVHPSQQPEHTVRDMKNFVPMDDGGNTMTAINEDGTVLMDTVVFPDGFRVIGKSVLNTDIIVVIADENGNSQVGVVAEESGSFVYTPIAPYDELTDSVPTDNKELGFNQNYPVDCVSRKLINGHRLLYYTDNNIPFGRIDLDEPPLVGDASDQSSLIPSTTIPEIDVVSINEPAVASIKPGVYQFVTRYVTSGGGDTVFGIPTNPIPMVPTQKTSGVDSYAGDYNDGEIVNKSITVQISNIDQQFDELELVVLYYEGNANIFQSARVASIPISGETLTYEFTGVDTEEALDITQAELEQQVIAYSKAKCIEQKDNYLFLSNLSAESVDTDLLQTIANQVDVRYNVNEIPFSGRGDSEVAPEVFTLISLPFLSDNRTIVLRFSQAPAAATVSDFRVNSSGTPATATVEVTDNTLLAPGDEIAVGAFGSQVAVTFTAIANGSPIANNEFNIGADATETLQNISDAVANSTDVDQYFATDPDGTTITLTWGVVDIAVNGTTVTTTSAGMSTTNFAGAVLNDTTFPPDSVDVEGTNLVLNFTQDINPSDTLDILSELFNSNNDQSIPAVPGLALTLDDSSFSDEDLPTGFTDYIEEIFSTNAKTYRRGEVYSLGFALVLKNGSTTPAFHIPGKYIDGAPAGESTPPVSAWPSYATGLSSGDLGTFVSNIEYPSGQFYPPDDPATPTQPRNIRHHYIPELENEPHFRKTDNGQVIRVISLEFDFNLPIPQSILENVEEILFLRENRDVDNNKSIFTQGLAINSAVMCFTYDSTSHNGDITGSDKDTSAMTAYGYGSTEKSNLRIAPGPSFGNMKNIGFFKSGETDKQNDSGGFPEKGFVFNQDSNYNQKTALDDQAMFYSPESVLENPFLTDSLAGLKMKREMSLKSTIRELYNLPDVWRRPDVPDFRYFLKNYSAYGQHADFNDYLDGAIVGQEVTLQAARLIRENSSNGEIDTGRLNTDNRYGSQGLEILTENNTPIPAENIDDYFFVRNVVFPNRNSSIATFNTYTGNPDIEKNLYNIRATNPTQYSSVSVAKYLPIARRKPTDNGGLFITNYAGVFGGDTFISKFGVINSSTIGYWPFNQHNKKNDNANNAIHYRTNTTRDSINEDYPVYTNNSEDIFWPGGLNFKANMYFFVESSINTNYRHRESTINEDTGARILERNSYYPLTNDPVSLVRSHVSYLGNPNSYNFQYSFDNFVKNFFPLGSRNQGLTTFENRTIYSVKAASDDTLDSYREFLINDYYDLPAHTGPIWDSFVHNNRLYLHTTKSLWLTSAQESGTLQGGDIDDVVLGQARLFNQPSVEMTTSEGGHGGTISQYGGIHTEIGYIFPDVLQGKIFGLVVGKTSTGVSTGTKLKELSLGSISTDMRRRLPKGIIDIGGVVSYENVTTKNSNLIDNPFLGIGLSGGFDYRFRRAWMVKHGEDPFTLAYSTIMNNFFSYHDYQPNVIIPYDNRVFFVRNQDEIGLITGEMHEMNIGNKGQYFGTYYPSHVEYIMGARIPINTMFSNMQIDSESTNTADRVKVRDDNFDTIQVWTDRQNTGIYTMQPFNEKTGFPPATQTGILLLKYRNDEYRLAIPRDAVINNDEDIFEPNNIDQSAQFRERIKNTYAHVKFVYENEKFDINNNRINLEFLIKMIEATLHRNDR